MIISPALYVFLIAAIILLSIVLLSVVITYVATIRRLTMLEREKDNLYEDTKREQHRALLAAQNKASEIISDAGEIKNQAEDALNKAVADMANGFIEAYKKQAEELNKDSINSYNNISLNISKYVETHLEDLKKTIAQQTIDSQKIVEVKFKEEYEKLEREMTEYKKKRVDEIDNNIYQLLLNVSKVAFGKGISMDKHEEIIAEALEEARKEIR